MKSSRKNPSHQSQNARPKLGWVILADIVLVGLGLVIFALFHHVLPRDFKTSGKILPTPSVVTTTTASEPSMSETTSSISSTTVDTTPSSAETTVETTVNGTWGAKFPDRFTTGRIEITDNHYRSEAINITISQVQENEVTYYIADIYLRDLEHFRTAFAGGTYARGKTATVLEMAKENHAVLAISGDYYGIRDSGVVIRNGELFRENLFDDVLLMNHDGSMQTFTRDEFDIEQVKLNGAWQAWSFGPMLLDDGQPMTSFNSTVTRLNPRSAIGYYEPGHYCFVLVDGRQPDYSIGMTMEQLSRLFYDLGCEVAYNLDGGQSAVMVFNGEWVNQPYKDGRRISDIIWIGE